ncbi:hypothetical protein HON59_00085, partial [bacterium]|nr:hypothetical protein [bacterium]
MFLDDKKDENLYMDKSDEEILSQSINHPYLFGILLDRYQDAFLRKALSVLGNKEDAEDIVQ